MGEKWDVDIDEAISLVSTKGHFIGLRGYIDMPTNYACATGESYFNFYVGLVAGSNDAIEAGYSFALHDAMHSKPRWAKFINPESLPISNRQETTPAKRINFELSLDKTLHPVLKDNLGSMRSHHTARPGQIKLVAALREQRVKKGSPTQRDKQGNVLEIKRTDDRIVWFNKVQIVCTEVLQVGITTWTPLSKAKVAWTPKSRNKYHLQGFTIGNGILQVGMNKPK